MTRILSTLALLCASGLAYADPDPAPTPAPAETTEAPAEAEPTPPAETAPAETAPAETAPQPPTAPSAEVSEFIAEELRAVAPSPPPAPAVAQKTVAAATDAESPTKFRLGTLSIHLPFLAAYRLEDATSIAVDLDGNTTDPDPASNVQIRAGATLSATPSKVTRFSLEYEHDLYAGQLSGGATGTPELVHGPLEGGTETTLRRAFAKLRLGPVFFGGGFTVSHWGLGLLANDGAHGWTSGSARFSDPRGGDRVRRGYVGVGPIPQLDLLVMGAYDSVVGDDVLLSDDDAEQYLGSVIVQPGKPRTAGVYVAHRTQKHADEKTTEVTVFDLYLRWTADLTDSLKFVGAMEGAVIAGDTGLGPNPEFPSHEVYQVGVAARGEIRADDWGTVLDFFYASGDRNLDDGEVNAFRADRNYELGLLLFRHVIAAHTARSPVRASDLDLIGVPAEDLDRFPSRGSATNAWVLFPRAWWRSSGGFEIYGGPMLAFSDVELIDPRNTRLAGGALRNGHDGAPGGLLGTELDLGVRYHARFAGVALSVGFEGATFIPGGAFADANGDPIGPVHGFRASTRIEL